MANSSRGNRAKGTGSIYQKGGYYVAQVHDGYTDGGRPRYRQAQRKSHAEAVKALNELQAKVTLGSSIGDGRAPNVSAWLDTWLEEHIAPNKAPKTYEFYKLNVDRVKPILGRTDLRRLKPTDVSATFAKLERAGASKNTIDATRRTLRAALSVAVKYGHCAENPVSKTFAIKVERKPRPFFTPEQIQKLLKELKGSPIENLVRFTLATALRVGEATGLSWSDVDLAAERFTVSAQLQRVAPAALTGIGAKKALALRPLKTEKSKRTLPLVGESLSAVRDERARQSVEPSENHLDLVFLNPYGRPFDPKYVDERLKEALVKAKLPMCGMHALRHSAATFMLMNGLNMHQVSRYLGHSQIALTSNIYGHVLEQGMEEAAKAVQRAYSLED
jgi:integrase